MTKTSFTRALADLLYAVIVYSMAGNGAVEDATFTPTGWKTKVTLKLWSMKEFETASPGLIGNYQNAASKRQWSTLKIYACHVIRCHYTRGGKAVVMQLRDFLEKYPEARVPLETVAVNYSRPALAFDRLGKFDIKR